MMAALPKASVVITNPTHYAIALQYEHGIPIVENPPLAQALYKSVDVGQQIPANFYRAIAEILAYIYKLRGKR